MRQELRDLCVLKLVLILGTTTLVDTPNAGSGILPAPADLSGPELVLQAGHDGAVNSVAFSPDGRRILTGSSTGMATLWDADTGKRLRDLGGHGGSVNSVAFGPDGRRALTGSHDRTATLWDADTGRRLVDFRGQAGRVYAVAISPDGRRALTGSS